MLFADRARPSTRPARNLASPPAESAAFNCGLHHRASFDEDIFLVKRAHHPKRMSFERMMFVGIESW